MGVVDAEVRKIEDEKRRAEEETMAFAAMVEAEEARKRMAEEEEIA